MLERMEVAEHVYEGGTPSKIPTREYANRDGHVRKLKGGESAYHRTTTLTRSEERRVVVLW